MATKKHQVVSLSNAERRQLRQVVEYLNTMHATLRLAADRSGDEPTKAALRRDASVVDDIRYRVQFGEHRSR